jgi:hypothetical protein
VLLARRSILLLPSAFGGLANLPSAAAYFSVAIGFHSVGSTGTLHIDAGLEFVSEVARFMGHAKAIVTKMVHAHLLAGDRSHAMEDLGAMEGRLAGGNVVPPSRARTAPTLWQLGPRCLPRRRV